MPKQEAGGEMAGFKGPHTITKTASAPEALPTKSADGSVKVHEYLGVEDTKVQKPDVEPTDTAPVVMDASPDPPSSGVTVVTAHASDAGSADVSQPAADDPPTPTRPKYKKPSDTAEKVHRQQQVIKYQTQRADAMKKKLLKIREIVADRKREMKRRQEEKKAEGPRFPPKPPKLGPQHRLPRKNKPPQMLHKRPPKPKLPGKK